LPALSHRYGIAALKRLGLFRGRLVLSYHGTDVKAPANRIESALRHFVLRAADGVVACSPSLADRMAETFGFERSKIQEIGNGADSEVFNPAAVRPPGFDADLPPAYILSVGSFIKRKDHQTTLAAFARIADSWPGLSFVVAGAMGDEYAALKRQVEATGLTHRVILLTNLEQLAVAFLLAHCSVCVQASLAESQPLAVLEAGAGGAPIVASDIPGHIELIKEHVTGLRFSPGDVDGCARAISHMLSDTDAAKKMAMTFCEVVKTHHTWRECAGKYAALYGIVDRTTLFFQFDSAAPPPEKPVNSPP
jgi:glycogen(starch) synthase